MRNFLLVGLLSLAACGDSETTDGTGGGSSVSTSTSTPGNGAASGNTTGTASSSTGAGAGGGAEVVLPENQYLVVAMIWQGTADAPPEDASAIARVDVLDPMNMPLPEGLVEIGNGLEQHGVPYDGGLIPPYQTMTSLAYTNVVTFDVQVDGEHGYGSVDLGFPWITDFSVALPAIAANEIALTWTPTPDAMCRAYVVGPNGPDPFPMVEDEGHYEIPAGELDPGQSTISLECTRIAYASDRGYFITTQLRGREVLVE